MSGGVVTEKGDVIPLFKIEAFADVTDDFGVFTLKQYYFNNSNTPIDAKFIFPILDGVVVSEFKVYVNGVLTHSTVIDKKYYINQPEENKYEVEYIKQSEGSICIPLGVLNEQSEIVTELLYMRKISVENERTRIIIPTIATPRFVPLGQQMALETLNDENNCSITLDLTYTNANITNVVSSTHNIIADIMHDKVNIKLEEGTYADKDIIIDIFCMTKYEPKVFLYENIICCDFSPEIDVYDRQNREYLFMLDVSDSMAGAKLEQAKAALIICLRALTKKDKFNIIVFDGTGLSFSEEFLYLNEDTLTRATDFIKALAAKGEAEVFRPIINAYKEAEGRIALLFSAGHIQNSEDILSYSRQHKGVSFYTFGIDSADNEYFLTRLSAISGGRAQFITPAERIDDAVIQAFNTIAAPSITNVVLDFDKPALNITPEFIKKIHCGDRILIMANVLSELPKMLTITGELSGSKVVMDISLSNVLKTGISLKYLYLRKQVNDLSFQLNGGGGLNDKEIIKKIVDISINNSFITHYTSFVTENKVTKQRQIIGFNMPVMPSKYWFFSTGNILRDGAKRTKTEEHFVELAKNQQADGSFVPSHSILKESIALYSAEVLYEFCAQCPNINMYVWHMRKAAEFLINYVEMSNYGLIPREIVNALAMWNEVLGGNDEISQKAAVLEFLHREK